MFVKGQSSVRGGEKRAFFSPLVYSVSEWPGLDQSKPGAGSLVRLFHMGAQSHLLLQEIGQKWSTWDVSQHQYGILPPQARLSLLCHSLDPHSLLTESQLHKAR